MPPATAASNLSATPAASAASGERQPVMRDHRLVGGHQRLARAERIARRGKRRPVRAPDQFDHHVDIVACGHRGHVVFPGIGRKVDAAILAALTRAHRDYLQRPARAPRDQRAIGFDQANDARAHRAEAGKCDTERFGHTSPKAPAGRVKVRRALGQRKGKGQRQIWPVSDLRAARHGCGCRARAGRARSGSPIGSEHARGAAGRKDRVGGQLPAAGSRRGDTIRACPGCGGWADWSTSSLHDTPQSGASTCN